MENLEWHDNIYKRNLYVFLVSKRSCDGKFFGARKY